MRVATRRCRQPTILVALYQANLLIEVRPIVWRKNTNVRSIQDSDVAGSAEAGGSV